MRARPNFSSGRNVSSVTAPVLTFLNLARTIAVPRPILTCAKSSTWSSSPLRSTVLPGRRSPALIIPSLRGAGDSQDARHRVDGEHVAVRAEPGDDAARRARRQRGVPVALARVDVGEVHLDDGLAEAAHGVEQGDAGVGQGAPVEDAGVGGVALGFEQVDQLALVVALLEAHLHAVAGGALLDHAGDVLEPGVAVDLRLAAAQARQVGAVEDEDASHARAASTRASRTASSGTTWPKLALPRRSSSTQRTAPARDFLSARVASTTRWASIPDGTSPSPQRRSTPSCQAASAAGQPLRCTLSRPATRMPAATASPCTSVSPWPVTVSNACPTVCP